MNFINMYPCSELCFDLCVSPYVENANQCIGNLFAKYACMTVHCCLWVFAHSYMYDEKVSTLLNIDTELIQGHSAPEDMHCSMSQFHIIATTSQMN